MRPIENFWGLDLDTLYTKDISGCWIWAKSKHKTGYGQYKIRGKVVRAHRYFYEVLVGEIPDGLVVHHKCFNRACVNPEHLELITHSANASRKYRKPRR